MADRFISEPHAFQSTGWADAVANRALAVVAARKATGQRKLDPELLAMMRSCLLTGERPACAQTVASMTDAGVPKDDIVDLYIPALARQLGEEWCDDEISFADVTIGTSKLQSLLRELAPDWHNAMVTEATAFSMLVLVAEGEDHTLGAQVLAGQLRREGYSVQVRLSADEAEVADAFNATTFDVIFVSTSSHEVLPAVTKLVDIVRNNSTNSAPVVVGGALDLHTPEVKALTGADLVTSNIEEALHFCGLSLTQLGDKQRDQSG